MFSAAKSAAPSGAAYQIERSLRLNSADSAYLSRTPGGAGNRDAYTVIFWFKPSNFSGTQTLLSAYQDSNNQEYIVLQDNSGSFQFQWDSVVGGSYTFRKRWAPKIQDPTAWGVYAFVYDSANGTAADRVRFYKVLPTGFERITTTDTLNTDPSSGQDSWINSTNVHYIGRQSPGSYLNGYLAEFRLIDGTALSSFSDLVETSATTGAVNPKNYTGTYGTNGFYVNFSDNSGTTATTLGKDSSGNGNNWTPTNFSVSAGAGNDSLTDTPTNYGSGNAGGDVRGNYAILSAINKNASGTLANGGLDYTGSGSTDGSAVSTFPFDIEDAGGFYAEATLVAASFNSVVGFCPYNFRAMTSPPMASGTGCKSYYSDGNKYDSNTGSAYGNSFTTGDTIALLGKAGKIYFGKISGTTITWQNSGDPSAGTGYAFTGLTGLWLMFVGDGSTASAPQWTVNFGQRAFLATNIPSGAKACCTQNLANSAVVKPTTGFYTSLYTGTGATLNITGLSFGPDFVWIKSRSAATDNTQYDVPRGVQARLESNTVDAETTGDDGLTAFGSAGFTLGTLAQVNTNAATYVAWCWEESATYGFDIVLYTGTGAAHTENHGLGAVPSLIICKNRTNAFDWPVYHSSISSAETKVIYLDAVNAAAVNGDWNNTAPTSSVFSVGTLSANNQNTASIIAYLWAPVAGFSSFGSYTGNGSTDGPAVAMGFLPAWMLFKISSGTPNSWVTRNNQTSTYNPMTAELIPNNANAETTGAAIDALATGCKIRATSLYVNENSSTFIFAAFAADNFKNARAF
jgi:hypothetical protein